MAQSVSAAFLAAQKSDVAQYGWKVQLVLGDYANSNGNIGGFTPTASADSSTTNYPAAGAINGDRTELNIGAASGSDNGVGQASWRSTSTPDSSGGATYLEVDFGTTRTYNRVKVYNLNGHGLKAYNVQHWDGAAWVTDYAFSGGGSAGRVDTIDLTTDISSAKLRINPTNTAVAGDYANIVEVEVYRRVDVSNRIIDIETDRQRDFKLKNPIASTATLTLGNTDQFFSLDYTPTSAQVTSGFVNSELRPNIGLIVQEGFYTTSGAPELVTTFTGYVDQITDDAGSRKAIIRARDGMKGSINASLSTNLKTNELLSDAAIYLLNLANFSTWEMSVQTVNVTLPYFFTYETTAVTALQNIAEASIFPVFYFDESGKAAFTTGGNFSVYYKSADWSGGTVLTNVDASTLTNAIQKKWFMLDNFSAGSHNLAWVTSGTVSTGGSYTTIYDSAKLYTPFTHISGTWETSIEYNADGTSDGRYYLFMSAADLTGNGYVVKITNTAVTLYKDAAGVLTSLITFAWTPDVAFHKLRVTRDGSGNFTLYWDTVSKGTATDATYNTSGSHGWTNTGTPILEVNGDYFSNIVDGSGVVSGAAATYESSVIDQGSSVEAEGILWAIYDTTPTDTSITFYTATSADNVTWEAYKIVSAGGAISSTAQRYIKFKAVLSGPDDVSGQNVGLATATLYEVVLTWSASANISLRYDSQVLGIQYTTSDELSGDTSVYNDLTVTGSPIVLTGAATDTQWQGTAGSPPAAIAAGNTLWLAWSASLQYFDMDIPGGMDTSGMAGGSALVLTVGTAVINTSSFSRIHPTKPQVAISVKKPGTIVDFRLVGKAFTASGSKISQSAKDTASIALYGGRPQKINNPYIVLSSQAAALASQLVLRRASQTKTLPMIETMPLFSAQIGDTATVVDTHTGLNSTATIVGIKTTLSVSMQSATAKTQLKLLF